MKKLTLLALFILTIVNQIIAQEKPHLFDNLPNKLTMERKNTDIDNPQQITGPVQVEAIIPTKEKFPFKTKLIQKKFWDDGSVTTLYELKGDYPPGTYMVINKLKKPNEKGFFYRGHVMNKNYSDAFLISDEVKNQLNFEKVLTDKIICTGTE
jgi:hypothetical protein